MHSNKYSSKIQDQLHESEREITPASHLIEQRKNQIPERTPLRRSQSSPDHVSNHEQIAHLNSFFRITRRVWILPQVRKEKSLVREQTLKRHGCLSEHKSNTRDRTTRNKTQQKHSCIKLSVHQSSIERSSIKHSCSTRAT